MEKKVDILDAKLEDLIDMDFPDTGPITDDVIKRNLEKGRYLRGSVRLMHGLIWTDEDYRRHREEVLARPLP